MFKETFIRKVEKFIPLMTLEDLKNAKDSEGIGADGVSIAVAIIYLRNIIKDSCCRRNKVSGRKMVRWLKSEMRSYMDFGSWDPFVGDVCKRIYTLMYEKRLREQENN